MDTAKLKEDLLKTIKEKAFIRGEERTLASGKKSNFYIDGKQVTLDAHGLLLVGKTILAVLSGVKVDAIGGPTLGADPIAAAVMHQGVALGKTYDAFVVRKEPKDHGRGRQVEGPDLQGKRVIVLEDTSTTGGSPLKAVEALLKVGAIIAGVAVVVDRATGAREIIEAAGYPYYAAIGLEDLGLA